MTRVFFFNKTKDTVPSFADVQQGDHAWIGPISNCSLYKIKKIKYGGMSKILFLEHDKYIKNQLTNLPEKIILKGIRNSSNEEQTTTLLQNELIKWADIDHQNVTKCMGIGKWAESNGDFREIFALIEKNDGDLRYLLQRLKIVNSCFGVSETLRAGAIILRTLDFIYKTKKVLHQDIKPGNILFKKIRTDENVIFKNLELNLSITDWGISEIHNHKLNKTKDQKEFLQTILGNGTPLYMSPERFTKNNTPKVSQDIFSIGLLLFELFDGNHLFFYRDLLYRNTFNDHWLYPKNINDAAIKFMQRADYTGVLHCYEHFILNKGYTYIKNIDFQTRKILNLIRLFIEPDQKKRIESFDEAIKQIEAIVNPTRNICFKRYKYTSAKLLDENENINDIDVENSYECLIDAFNNNKFLLTKNECDDHKKIAKKLQKTYVHLIAKAFLQYESLQSIQSDSAKKLLKKELQKIYESIYIYGKGNITYDDSILFSQHIIPFLLKTNKYKCNKNHKEEYFLYIHFLFMAFSLGTLCKLEQERLEILEIDHHTCISCRNNEREYGDEIQWVCCLKCSPNQTFGEIILIDFHNLQNKKITEDNLLDIFPRPALYYIGIQEDDIDDSCREYCTTLENRFEIHKLDWFEFEENDLYRFSKIKKIGYVPNLPNDKESIYNFLTQWDLNTVGYNY